MNFLRTYTQLLRQNTVSVLGYFVPQILIAVPLEFWLDNPFQHDFAFFTLVAISFYTSLALTIWYSKQPHNLKTYAKQALRLLCLVLMGAVLSIGPFIVSLFFCLAPNTCLPTNIAGVYLHMGVVVAFLLIVTILTFVEAFLKKSPQ